MKLDYQQVFESHEPPPGGLRKLGVRLDAERQGLAAQERWLWLGAAGAVAVVTLLFGIRVGPDSIALAPVEPLPGRQELTPALVALGLAPRPTDPVSVPSHAQGHVAVRRIEVATDDVVFYLVAGTSVPRP